jgi:hypothetical protein
MVTDFVGDGELNKFLVLILLIIKKKEQKEGLSLTFFSFPLL